MEKILETMVVTSPGLVAMLLCVYFFVRYLERRETANQVAHQEHIDERKQCRVALEASARSNSVIATETQKLAFALNANTEHTKRVSGELSNLAKVISDRIK